MFKFIAPLLVTLAFTVAHSTSAAAAADSLSNAAKIKALSENLKQYARGILLCSAVRGENADMMIKDFALRIKYANPEDIRIQNYPRALPEVNADSGLYGLTRVEDAANLMKLIAEMYDDGLVFNIRDVKRIMNELLRAGALLAYTSDGLSSCGSVYPSVLVIDENSHKIYEVALNGEQC